MAHDIAFVHHTPGLTLKGLLLDPTNYTQRWNGTGWVAIASVADADWETGLLDFTEQQTGDATGTAIYVAAFPDVGATPNQYPVLVYESPTSAGDAGLGLLSVYWDGAAVSPSGIAARILSLFDGMFSVGYWLRCLGRSDTNDVNLDRAQAEINFGTGTFNRAAHSEQAIAAAQSNPVTLSDQAKAGLVVAIEAEIANDATGTAVKQAIIDQLLDNLPDLDDLTLAAIATAARDAILNRVLAGNHEIEGSVGQRLQQIASLPTADTIGANVAGRILATPDNKLATNASGQVDVSGALFDPGTQEVETGMTYQTAVKAMAAVLLGKTNLPDGQTVEYLGRDGSVVVTIGYGTAAGQRISSVIA